ncbi:fibronectin type III domain-containing protein [Candidatus Uhrbacteria bacterium]|nr:fibronectin type III domain-containing protein [Candidatus Uhrbacteria bacterium]
MRMRMVAGALVALMVVFAYGCGGGGGGGGGGTTPVVTPPTAPSNVVATAMSATSIRVTWSDNSSNENGFTIEYLISPATTFQTAGTVAANVTTFTHTGLRASTTYVYRVKATNAGGSTISTNQASGTTNAASGGGSGTWMEQTLPTAFQSYSFTSIAGSSSNDLFASGYKQNGQSGFVLHKDATTWTEQSLPVTGNFVGQIQVFASNNVYALAYFVTGAGYVLHWNGATWSVMFQKNNWTPYSISVISATNMYVAGTNGVIVHWDGTTWIEQTTGTTRNLYGIWAASSTDLFAVGGYVAPSANPIILHSTNGGTTWSSQALPSSITTRLIGIAGVSGSNVVAVGDSGTILRYNGTSWVQEISGTTDTIVGPWMLGSAFVTSVYHLAPMQGELLQSNATNSWGSRVTVPGEFFTWVQAVSGTNAFALAGNPSVNPSGVIYHYDGSQWTLDGQTRAPVFWVFAASSSDIWAVGANGLMLRRQ